MIKQALGLRKKGIRVIPLCWPVEGECGCGGGHTGRDVGKAPLLRPGWQKEDPSTADIEAWWEKWPRANVGIRLDVSALLVVDVDSDDAQVEADKWGLPETLVAKTGKGRHYYYRARDEHGDLPQHRRTHRGKSKAIDVLSLGYVVAPPSTHMSGHEYRWEVKYGTGLADAPSWARGIISPPKPAPKPYTPPPTGNDTFSEAQAALAFIDSDCGHDEWIQMGMAIHDIDSGNAGLALWDQWSSRGEKYKDGECERRWRSFGGGGGVTKGSLFHKAMEGGWVAEHKESRPSPTVPAKKTPPAKAKPAEPKCEIMCGDVSYVFGKKLQRTQFKVNAKGEESEEVMNIAIDVYPRARTRDAECGAHGMVLDFITHQKQRREIVVPARAWGGDRSATNQFVSEAMDAGLKLLPMKGLQLATAAGAWSTHVEDAATITTVVRPGWHQESTVYVNGSSIYGADWVYRGVGHRGRSKGDLQHWVEGVSELASTKGLVLALGMAFSGALIGPLGRSGWLLHMCGPSTTGKTRAAKLAASVWYSGDAINTWNGTANGIENTLEGFSGAMIVLDEIKEAAPHQVGDIVHRISDNTGRVRSNRMGTANQRQRTWALTGLSTGEVTVADYMGGKAQGGHLVRCVDLWIRRGEATVDAIHSDQIDEFCRLHFGTGGDAWAKYLVENPKRIEHCREMSERITQMLLEYAPDPEAQRVLRALALVGASLLEAARAGLWDHPSPDDRVVEVITWAVERIVEERGAATSPEARAWLTLLELMESRPSLFVHETEYRRSHEAVGMWSGGALYTTEGMLKNCETFRAAGVSARRFLSWCTDQGLSSDNSEQWGGGHRGNWRRINIHDSRVSAEENDDAF